MLFLSKANEFSSQNIPKTEKWKHTVKTTRKPSVPPSVPELAQASAIFVKKNEKNVSEEEELGYTPSVPQRPRASSGIREKCGKKHEMYGFPFESCVWTIEFLMFFFCLHLKSVNCLIQVSHQNSSKLRDAERPFFCFERPSRMSG